MPLGLGLKQLAAAQTAPTPLVEWRTDHALTVSSGANTWTSRIPAGTYQLTSNDAHTLLETSSWQNSQPGVGFANNQFGYTITPGHECFVITSGSAPPLSGTDLTIYLVMDFHCYGNPPGASGTGPCSVFQIGEENHDATTYAQFSLWVDNAGSYIYIQEQNSSGSAEYQDKYFISAIGNSPYLIGPTIVVAQSHRNTGHNLIFGGVTQSSSGTTNVGTVPNLTTDQITVCGELYVSGGATDTNMLGCTVGNVIVYNAYHSAGTIATNTAALQAFWGL